jgi:naphthalene 1,2-dioxygenase ferredoxin reductase component
VNDRNLFLGGHRIVQVAVHPTDRALAAPVGANLLGVLREHEIPVSYSCTDGRCGTCRCKLLTGEVLETGWESARSATNGARYVLACQTTVVESCEIEIPEPDEVVVHPARLVKATVARLDDLTHDVKRLCLRPAGPLAFSPGQYATLAFTRNHVRPYSMAGLANDGELEFHLQLEPRGRVTTYVAETLRPGDAVRVSGPLGTAYLRHLGPMLCIAGGTGLAPMLSIVRGALASGMTNPIHLYFGVSSSAHLYGVQWLEELANRHRNLKLHVVVNAGNTAPRFRRGLVTDAVAHDWKSLAGWRAYLAGTPAVVEAATLLVRRNGVHPEHIHAEAFYPNGT